jgi:hypothetical protein
MPGVNALCSPAVSATANLDKRADIVKAAAVWAV